jgi:hypothetical protein
VLALSSRAQLRRAEAGYTQKEEEEEEDEEDEEDAQVSASLLILPTHCSLLFLLLACCFVLETGC